jgi:pseudouridine-5'-phosphate glycosidase
VLTDGRSLAANVALIKNNAAFAADLALALVASLRA